MRVRPLGSHHQKMVVLRHPGRPELDVAFVGGIDLCHSRRDSQEHPGDPQAQPMASVYGPRPPWHDIQLAIRGPAVADVETVFRERWEDPQPLTRNPLHRIADRLRGADTQPGALPPAPPEPSAEGTCAVQVLRTYPRRRHGYSFAPDGERSVARAYSKALRRARSLIYVEDQYLWSRVVAATFADALRAHPSLRLIAVVPHHPDQDGPAAVYPQHVGRQATLELLVDAGGDRVAVYGIENDEATPIYVHAKTCVIDDVWAAVGSDNFNRRSWTWDSELGIAVVDEALDERAPDDPGGLGDGARRFARHLRLALAREHLGRAADDVDDLLDPVQHVRGLRPRRGRAPVVARRRASRAPAARTGDAGLAGGGPAIRAVVGVTPVPARLRPRRAVLRRPPARHLLSRAAHPRRRRAERPSELGAADLQAICPMPERSP